MKILLLWFVHGNSNRLYYNDRSNEIILQWNSSWKSNKDKLSLLCVLSTTCVVSPSGVISHNKVPLFGQVDKSALKPSKLGMDKENTLSARASFPIVINVQHFSIMGSVSVGKLRCLLSSDVRTDCLASSISLSLKPRSKSGIDNKLLKRAYKSNYFIFWYLQSLLAISINRNGIHIICRYVQQCKAVRIEM